MYKYDIELFGKQFRDIRENRGYSIRKLHKESGIALNTIRNIERSVSLPTTQVLVIISDTLNFDLIDLLDKCKFSWTFKYSYFQKKLNSIFDSREYEQLSSLRNELHEYLQVNIIQDISILNSLNQIQKWIEGLIIAKEYNDQPQAIDFYFKALHYTLNEVSKTNYKDWKYSPQELDILNSIASSFLIDDQLIEAIDLYVYIQQNVLDNHHLYQKTCLNLSSSYYQLDNFVESLNQSQKGISYNLDNSISIDNSAFYYYKGRAENMLGIKNYKKSLKTSAFFYELEHPDMPNKTIELCIKNGFDI